jgi:crotonobetainyl-CoA:carnitine CoA-transferase CaiB-like acyl-CoA transferase
MNRANFLSSIRVLEIGGSATLRYAGHVLAAMGASVERLELEELCGTDDWFRIDDLNELRPFAEFLDAGKERSRGALKDVAALSARADILIHDRMPLFEEGPASGVWGSLPRSLVVVGVNPENRPVGDPPIDESDMIVQHRGGVAFNRTRPVADPESQPPVAGVPFEMSLGGGVATASAALAGVLARRNRAGGAPRISFALLDYCSYIGIEALAEWEKGTRVFERKRTGNTGVEVAGGSIWVLPCADGWVMVSPREEHQWQRWLPVIGSPDWAGDADLCGDRKRRKVNWARIQQLMGESTRLFAKAEIFEAARRARVPCFPVSTIENLFDNEQLEFRQFFNTMATSSGTLSVPGLPFDIRTTGSRVLPRGVEIDAPPASGMKQEGMTDG